MAVIWLRCPPRRGLAGAPPGRMGRWPCMQDLGQGAGVCAPTVAPGVCRGRGT